MLSDPVSGITAPEKYSNPGHHRYRKQRGREGKAYGYYIGLD